MRVTLHDKACDGPCILHTLLSGPDEWSDMSIKSDVMFSMTLNNMSVSHDRDLLLAAEMNM